LQPIGTLVFNRAAQPVDQLFAMQDGFWDLFNWSSSNSVFLEHFFGGNNTYVFGKQYTPSTVQDFNGRLVQFNNSAYVSHDVGSDVTIDRFVTGTTLASITCQPTFSGAGTLQVTINLNRPVQAGETVTVALNSSTPNVILENSTQAQNFTLTT